MRSTSVAAPDGRRWTVRAFRVRLPPWRQIDAWGYSQSLGGDFDLFSIALALIALPFTLLLIPLAIAIVEFPLAVGRAAFSRTVWVEAASHWPREERLLWRTSRADAPGVHAAVAAQLSAGEIVRPARAELVEDTTALE
jgi:hypothetical protein